MNDRLKKWISWLKIIEQDIQRLLLHRNVFWELQDIIRANSEINKPNLFYTYIGDTYVAYILIGIRRQIKINGQSISFARLLSEIAQNPIDLSRDYYVSLYQGSSVENLADEDFDRFCGREKNFICPNMVQSDLEELCRTAKAVEGFADRRIAHYDKRQQKFLLRFEQVDQCLDTFDRIYCKYHGVFYASHLSGLTPYCVDDWKGIFTVPWLKYEESEE